MRIAFNVARVRLSPEIVEVLLAGISIAHSKVGHDAKALSVAFETVSGVAVLTYEVIEGLLGHVPERRVAKVVGQTSGFRNVGVQSTQGVSLKRLFAEQPLRHAAS